MKYPIHKHSKTIERDAGNEVATRQAANMVAHLLQVLPNPDPILRKTGKRIKVYRDLLGDWEVFSAVDLIHAGLQDLEWQLEQGDADQKAFDEFEKRFNDWDVQKIMSEAVDGRNFGYQPFEFIWDKTSDGWHISSIVGKPPEWFNFNAENELQFKSTGNRMGEPVRPYQFSCACHRESYNNPYGEAALSRVFWPVTFKKGGVEFMMKFCEKYGIPWTVGKQPRGAGDKAKGDLLDDLANMIQDAVAVIPDDASVDIMEAAGKGASSDIFLRGIHYFDAAINKVILSSETAMSVSKEGTDVRGSGAEHAKASKSVMRAIGGMASKVINQAIKWEWHFNHEGPHPVFSVYERADVQKDRAERDNHLKKQGVNLKENYYVKHYGLNEDEFELVDPEETPAGFSQHVRGCQCSGCRQHSRSGHRVFQEDPGSVETDRNQRVLDEMIEEYGGEDAAATNQQIMEKVLQPVIDLINTADSMEDVMERMAEQFPDMNTAALEDRIMKAMFLADTWGRLSAADEEEKEDEENPDE